MKKLSVLALAAACVLTFTAFGFTACGDDESENSIYSGSTGSDTASDSSPDEDSSTDTAEDVKNTAGDIVTEEEWLAVMAAENYNFTLDFELVIKTYDAATGELSADSGTSIGTIYSDLTVDEDKNITGNVRESFNSYSNYSNSNTMGGDYYFVYKENCVVQYLDYYTTASGSSETPSDTQNEEYSATSATLSDDDVECKTSCEVFERDSTYIGTLLIASVAQLYMAEYVGIYPLDTEDYFKYNEEQGAYVWSYNKVSDSYSTDYTYSIKINGGNISSFGAETYVEKDGVKSSESNSTYTYYNYGTTTVDIPDDIQAEIDRTYADYLSKSDKVTALEWVIAFSEEKALNVTINGTSDGAIGVNISEGDSLPSIGKIEHGNITLEYKSSVTDSGTYSEGAAYYYLSATDSSQSNQSITCYQTYSEDGISYVTFSTATGEDDKWNGATGSSTGIAYINNIKNGSLWTDELAGMYTLFTYKNGAYTYSKTENYSNYTAVTTYTIKIKDGNLTSLVRQIVLTPTDGEGETETVTAEYTFAYYGTTTVTVPEEYTYDYYIANN